MRVFVLFCFYFFVLGICVCGGWGYLVFCGFEVLVLECRCGGRVRWKL